MNDHHNGKAGRPRATDPHHWRSGKHGEDHYQVRFYPGFASKIVLKGQEETVLYQQGPGPEDCFVLPPGATRPLSSHALELSSADKGFTLGIHFDDPQHVIDHVTIRLRDPRPHDHYDKDRPPRHGVHGGGAGGGAGGGVMAFEGGGSGSGGTTLVVYNTPQVCPPDCPKSDGG
jgi:hypothetical protein